MHCKRFSFLQKVPDLAPPNRHLSPQKYRLCDDPIEDCWRLLRLPFESRLLIARIGMGVVRTSERIAHLDIPRVIFQVN